MNNILVCDDEKDIVEALKIYLSAEGYNVIAAYNGKEAVDIIESNKDIHLVLLDVMMPIMDGITAISLIRKSSNVPVILLTAKSEDTDKILGLNIGADDYITKPFNPVEMLARVHSQLRRYITLGSAGNEKAKNKIGNIEIDDEGKIVTVDGDPIALTKREYAILYLLMQNPGKLFSPAEIYRKIWNEEPFGAENVVAVHIRHLREKIEINPKDPRYLKVVWGQGYKMEE